MKTFCENTKFLSNLATCFAQKMQRRAKSRQDRQMRTSHYICTLV